LLVDESPRKSIAGGRTDAARTVERRADRRKTAPLSGHSALEIQRASDAGGMEPCGAALPVARMTAGRSAGGATVGRLDGRLVALRAPLLATGDYSRAMRIT